MITFPLFLFILVLTVLITWALGYRCGFQTGTDCGFDEGYDFATSDIEIAWRITAKGETALDAARTAKPAVQLSIHPSHLKQS